jgi:hypothetical protein
MISRPFPPTKKEKTNMKTKIILIASALAVANSVAAPPIPISNLPASITHPGTYVLMESLSYSAAQPAIVINSPTAGKIILDLGIFSIQEVSVLNTGIEIHNPTNSAIIVRGGQLVDFFQGVSVNPAATATAWVSNIKIEGVTFSGAKQAAILFNQVNNSTVMNCSFVGAGSFGIEDLTSQGGNRVVDCNFDGSQSTALAIGGLPVEHLVIDSNAQLAPSP